MIGYPLDSKVTFNEAGIPEFDRAISSAPLRTLIGKLFSNGVLPNPSTNLQVVAGTSGMTVVVKKGFAIVNGCLKLEETDRTLTLQASETNYDRIDTIVVRLNDESNARYCDLYVVTGTPASNPVRPELTRNASVYEIGLADIFVSKNTTTITQQRITDTRYETDRCGIISSISEFDTTTLYEQIQSDLADFKTEEQADFIAWFENIKTILDGNVAGHLQNEIDALDVRVTNNENGIIETKNTIGEQPTASAYVGGECIVFNGKLYRCKTLTRFLPDQAPNDWVFIGSVANAIGNLYNIIEIEEEQIVEDVTITPRANENYTILAQYAKKIGKVVQVYLQVRCVSTSSNFVVIGNVPNNCKPAMFSGNMAIPNNGGANFVQMGRYLLGTDGQLQFVFGKPSADYFISFTYIAS